MNKNKLLKIGAAVLAGGVLCGALVYYNFIEKDDVGAVLYDVCPDDFDFTLDYIYSVQDGEFVIDQTKSFTMSEQLGKVVVLNFWATNCQPCKEEIPHFNEFYEAYKDQGVEVVILNGETDSTAQGLLDNYLNNTSGTEYDTVYSHWKDFTCTFGRFEADNNVMNIFEVSPMLPVTVVVNRQGVIKFMTNGKMSYEELETVVLAEL